jgi:hypothetical protein
MKTTAAGIEYRFSHSMAYNGIAPGGRHQLPTPGFLMLCKGTRGIRMDRGIIMGRHESE